MSQTDSAAIPQPVLPYVSDAELLIGLEHKLLRGPTLHHWETDALQCCAAAQTIRQSVPGNWLILTMGLLIGPLVFVISPNAFQFLRLGGIPTLIMIGAVTVSLLSAIGLACSIVAFIRGTFGWYLASQLIAAVALLPVLKGLFTALELIQVAYQWRRVRVRQTSFRFPCEVWKLAKGRLKQIMKGNDADWTICPQNSFKAQPPVAPHIRLFENGAVLLTHLRGDALWMIADDFRQAKVQRNAANRAFVTGWTRRGRPVKTRVWLADEIAREWEAKQASSAAPCEQLADDAAREIVAEYEVSVQDYAEALRVTGKSPYRELAVILILLLVMAVPILFAPWVILIIWSVLVGLLIVGGVQTTVAAVRRTFKQQPSLSRRKRMSATDQRIVFSDEFNRDETRWEGITRFREGPGVFVIMPSLLQFWVIPKRAFAQAEELDRFRSLLQKKINQRREIPERATY